MYLTTLKMVNKINLVWLKRDLRSQDHLPLHEAEKSELPYIILFVFEPSAIDYPDTSLRHLQFQYFSLLNLNSKLSLYQKKVEIIFSELIPVLASIQEKFEINAIFSYQESGTQFSYERDKKVLAYCKHHGIKWKEFQRDGVIRGIKNRIDWDKQWYKTMHAPIIKNQFSIRSTPDFENRFPLPENFQEKLINYPKAFQPAGEDFAWNYLHSFILERGKNYTKHISKPMESRISCSRISPYLSWGNVSVKQVYQFVYETSKTMKERFPFTSFLTRLKWRCHFIQKFEVECRYETHCINAGYELLEHPKIDFYISSWKEAVTGLPLVDACMNCLKETGWINFRMRAMLVSFFCHHLYQDWREGVYHLAQLFLDYEPGIHYPQFQMQAGTTGINTIRIYNPVKQSQEQDPEGLFIKKWLPQLQNLPSAFIHEPHKMGLLDQDSFSVKIGKDYPQPIVDISKAGKEARQNSWGHRSNELVKQENKRILITHTRRKENDVQP